MNNLKKIESVKDIVDNERINLFLIKENLVILKFLLDEPEKIKDNYDLLYGLRNIVEFSSGQLDKSIDMLDIDINLWNIKN